MVSTLGEEIDLVARGAAALQPVHERFKRRIGLIWRFLLHPMSDPWDDGGATEIGAGHSGVGVKVHTWNKGAHGVALAGDEGRWLRNAASAQFGQIGEVEGCARYRLSGPRKPPARNAST